MSATPETTQTTAASVSATSTAAAETSNVAVHEDGQQTFLFIDDSSLSSAEAGTVEPSQPEQSLPSSISILPIVLVAVVVLAAAAALAVIFSRRKKAEQERRSYPEPSTKVPRRRTDAGSTAPVDGDMPRTEQIVGDVQMESRYRVGFAQTIGSRENQEDSYCISNWQDGRMVSSRGLLAAVADGIGGMSNGQVASGTVVRNMCARFERQNLNMAMSDRLLELAAQGHQDVLKIVQRGGNCGTTLVSVLIKDGQMVMLSVGDSRVSLYRSGMLLQLNREHVLGKESDEYSLLNNTSPTLDARKRKAITAYLGKPNLRLIDRTLNPMRLTPGDRLLLMSDGVFGTLSDDELIAAMQAPPAEAAQAVIQAVEAKGLPHQDNATIVIVEMQ